MNSRSLWALVLAGGALASLFALSFVATPVKFLAAGVSLEHLLAVGRVTFRASLGLECALLSGLLIVAPQGMRRYVALLGLILAFQWIAIMPALDARTLARIAGTKTAPAHLHHIWIALDVARLAVYGVIIRKTMRCLQPTRPAETLES